jgi:hypothetical protein
MANLFNVLQQLRQERKTAELQVEKLDEAISAVKRLVNEKHSTSSSNGAASGRVISVASRRRMARAQRARWAGARKNAQPANSAATPRRRTLSIAARRKIAAAQRARWAKVRAQGKKAA